MHIVVNGKQETVTASTIQQMVHQKNLDPDALVVALNQEVVPQEHWDRTALKDGDVVELLRFVGGG